MKSGRWLILPAAWLLACILLAPGNPAFGVQPGGVKWEYVTAHDPPYGQPGSPAIGDDGTVYIGSLNHRFYAFNPDGSVKWSYLGSDCFGYTAAIGDDGTIYVSGGHVFYAFNTDGSVKWVFTGPCLFMGAPAIAKDGTIYIGSNNSRLYAITRDGEKKWEFAVPEPVQLIDPVIDYHGTIYVGSNYGDVGEHKFYAIYPYGRKKWEYVVEGYLGIERSAAIGNTGLIYFGARDGNLYCLWPNGNLNWVFNADQTIESSLCIGADGTLYFSARHISYAVNPDGTEKWRSYISDNAFNSEPAIGANGIVYFGSWDFRIYALYPDGSEYWHSWTEGQVHSSPAIIDDGTLYVGRAYSVGAYYTDSYGVANSAWPMYRANLKRTARVEKYWFGMYFVDQLVAVARRSVLKKGTQNSMVAKLNSAAAALKTERPRPAINKLEAFVNQVEALGGKKISVEEAGYFMELAYQAIDAINAAAAADAPPSTTSPGKKSAPRRLRQ